MRKAVILPPVIILAIGIVASNLYGRTTWLPVSLAIAGSRTVAEIVDIYNKPVTKRLKPHFEKAGVAYPPEKITLLAIKDEKALEVWASDGSVHRYIHTYEIKKASGKSGPKLREGDRQVPEGIYRVVGLNPKSAYHLSMKLNYPNAFDLYYAKKEGRNRPGANIFIHGKAYSIGCLAMGDPAIEELFVLADFVGIDNISVIIAPSDPRKKKLQAGIKSPLWVNWLYMDIEDQFLKYRQNTITAEVNL